jgi:hypothetical protein
MKKQNRQAIKNIDTQTLLQALTAIVNGSQTAPVVAAGKDAKGNTLVKPNVASLRKTKLAVNLGTLELVGKGESTGGRPKFALNKHVVKQGGKSYELFVTAYQVQ